MPRWALLLLCAAYVLPGVFGRDPWKNADVTAFAAMRELALGSSSWWNPTVAGTAVDGGWLPYWLGAAFILALDSIVGEPLAARLAFAAVLAATLGLVWYATYHLARSEAAQPVPFAFGGEALPVHYARAMADGAVLALIACLGLVQLGHETTPELLQLGAVSLCLYAMAAASARPLQARAAIVLALPGLALSGAPAMAVALGLACLAVCLGARQAQGRTLLPWIVLATAMAILVATLLGAWRWRLHPAPDLQAMLRMGVWFTWPAWPLVAWTLWRWRRHVTRRHIAAPAAMAVIGILSAYLMGAHQRALMLALPALAVLAAFSLPTMQRTLSAAIDWFTLFFFSTCAITLWVIYISMHTGVPAKPAANVVKLAPGFEPVFSWAALAVALLASLAWIGLVAWRAGRHRPVLWKSLVLPASGVTLCVVLLLTLALPVLDYARSFRPGAALLAQIVPPGSCVHLLGADQAQRAGWAYYNQYRYADPQDQCPWLIVADKVGRHGGFLVSPHEWQRIASVRRPADKDDVTHLYRRLPAPPP